MIKKENKTKPQLSLSKMILIGLGCPDRQCRGRSRMDAYVSRYTVVIPKPGIATFPLGFAVAKGNQDLLNFLNNWLQIKKNSQQVKTAYDFWILARELFPGNPVDR